MYYNTVPKWYRMFRYPSIASRFYIQNLVKFTINKYTKRNISMDHAKKSCAAVGRPFLSNEKFNTEIKRRISSVAPFFCCRYGNSELTACFYALLRKHNILDCISPKLLKTVKTGSGVFPEDEGIYLQFADTYMAALGNADMNAYWGSVLMEEYMIGRIMGKDCLQYAMRALEPFQYDEPWTMALEGKNVLAVHPFAELIEEQYQRRDQIFPKNKILPNCNLKVVKAIQSSGETIPSEYANWNEALDALYERCMGQAFQVALLACGSYAVPLASRLKDAGKQVIVLGGMMQLMFGIKGARWETSRPDIVAMYNDAWVRAGAADRVKNADKMVDGAAYW